MAEKRLDIKITGDNSGFARAANGTIRTINNLQSSLSRVGGYIQTGFVAAAASVAKLMSYAGRIQDMATQLGISAESLQAFEQAAAQSGVSLEGVTRAVRELQRSQVAALGGNQNEAGAFARLGITMDELRTMRPEDLLMRVSESLRKSGQNATTLNDAMMLFGKSGGDMLSAVRSGFAELAAEIKRTQVASEASIQSLDRAGDKWSKFVAKQRAASLNMLGAAVEIGEKPSSIFGALKQMWSSGQLSISGLFGIGQIETVARLLGTVSGGMKGMPPPVPEPPPGSSNFVNPAMQSSMASYEMMMAKDALASENAATKSRGSFPSADALARVGGFRGGGSSIDRKLDEQTKQLKSITAELRKLNNAVEE